MAVQVKDGKGLGRGVGEFVGEDLFSVGAQSNRWSSSQFHGSEMEDASGIDTALGRIAGAVALVLDEFEWLLSSSDNKESASLIVHLVREDGVQEWLVVLFIPLGDVVVVSKSGKKRE